MGQDTSHVEGIGTGKTAAAIGRRRILVNPKVQVGFALAAAWMVLVAIGITAMTVYYTVAGVAFEPESRLALDRAWEAANIAVFWRLVAISAVMLGGTMLLTIYFLHRLVGPVYRIEQILRSAAAGENVPQSIKLRKNDEFGTLAGALLEMLGTADAASGGDEAERSAVDAAGAADVGDGGEAVPDEDPGSSPIDEVLAGACAQT